MKSSRRQTGRRLWTRSGEIISHAAELCEVRQLLSGLSAPINGVGNNETSPLWGSTGIELLRIADAGYADGVSSPAGELRPGARVVSNQVAAQSGSILNNRNLTDFVWLWGQFLDHDMDLTGTADPAEPFNISVPTGDPSFDPNSTGIQSLDLNRSRYVAGADSSDGLRQQLNSITAFIDGSVVYGSDAVRAAELRSFAGGHLKTSDGNLLPFNIHGLPNAGGTNADRFLGGDIRANENIALSSMHTLWVREHNRIVDGLAVKNPTWTDQRLYECGRSMVAAEIQAITYNEFLPALLGSSAIGPYGGYDSSVNPGISNEFSTAAYRFGHSLLSPELQRLNQFGRTIEEGPIALADAFFNPPELIRTGIDPLLRGAASQLAQEIDVHVVDSVRNFLFGPPGAGGQDLPSLNMQRGRDHGLADYHSTRLALGLVPINFFSDITSDPVVAATLEQTYHSVDDIDLWVGGLAEDHLPGSSLGQTFTMIVVEQFQRLRAGDRFWYENIFSGDQLQALRNTRLSDVIERNTDISGLQTNVFFAADTEIVELRFEQTGARKATVRAVNDLIRVVDDLNGKTVFSRAANDLAGLVLIGTDFPAERLTIDGSVTSQMLPAGITFISGSAGKDRLTIRGTNGDDTIAVDGQHADLNGLDIAFQNIDQLLVEGHHGNDRLSVSHPGLYLVTLDGGAGNDCLTGSDAADRLFGGSGNDRLFGGNGDDELYGGTGNDQLFGGPGRDRLIGGAGIDLLVQDGAENSPANSPRLAAFLDRQYKMTTTPNDFMNWGGHNERWFWSNAGWMFITPAGQIYLWDGQPAAGGSHVATVDVGCYASLASLCDHSSPFVDEDSSASLASLAKTIDSSLRLQFTGQYFLNWGGRNEKWLFGSQGWYFLTTEGRLYKWDGSQSAEGQLMAEFSSGFYKNPELLYAAG